jgi:hypothetical protein
VRTPSSGYGVHPATGSGTLALWVFDHGSGNLVYDVFSGRNLTDPAAMWGTGLIGGAVTFPGTGGIQDNVTAVGTDAATLQGAWSCEVWLRVMAAPASAATVLEYSDPTGVAVADNQQLSIQVNSDLTFRWEWKGAALQSQNSTAKLRAGVWQHVVVTKAADGAGTFTVSSYLNGVLDNTQTTIQPPTGGTDAKWLAGAGKGANFTGQVCSAHVTTTVLTSTQIVANWRRGLLWDDPGSATHGVTELQLTTTPSWSGSAIVLSSYLDAYDFVEEVSITESVDQSVMTASIKLKRQVYEISLAPLMTNSMANQNPQPSITAPGPASSTYAALLQLGAAVVVYARRRAAGVDDNLSAAGAIIFQGTIDSIDWSDDSINIECRDAGGALVDDYIEFESDFNTAADASIESTIQAILTAHGTGVTLYTPTSPSFMLGEFRQRRENIMASAQAKADQIGWITKYRFDPLTDSYRFTLYDPERTRTRFDGVVSVSDFVEFGTLSTSLTDVRNAVRVAYRNSLGNASGVDDNGNPIYPPASVTKVDGTSIAAYGRRFMEVSDSACPNIDTEPEAETMADAILNDLSEPQLIMELDVPYWEIELGDRLKFAENERTFDTAQTMAVLGRSVTFRDGVSSTALQLKETPASARQKHLVKEARNGRALPPLISVEDSPTDFGQRGRYGPIECLTEMADLTQVAPSLAGLQNPGFLIHPAGIGNLPVGWNSGSGSWGSAGDVYFSTTASDSGDRSITLLSVGAQVQSRWMPVIGGRVYQCRVTWTGSHATDELTAQIQYYDAGRAATSTTTVVAATPTSVGAFQVDAGVAAAGANDRWARVTISKTVGPVINVDRVQMVVIPESFQATASGVILSTAGTATIKWDTETFDYGDVYAPASGEFTAVEPGFHRFNAYVALGPVVSGTLAYAQLDMKVGGSTRWTASYAPPSASNFGEIWLHTPPTYLNAGNVVRFDLTIPVNCNITNTSGGGRRDPNAEW